MRLLDALRNEGLVGDHGSAAGNHRFGRVVHTFPKMVAAS